MTNIVYNCDCMEYMRTLPDKYFDVAITSPPYNEGSEKIFGYKNRKSKYNNNSDFIDNYDEWIYTVINLLIKKTKYYVFFNIQRLYGNGKLVYDLISKYKHTIKDIFIWVKLCYIPVQINHKKGVSNGYEYIFCLSEYDNKERAMYKRSNIKNNIPNYIIKENTKNIDYKDIIHSAIFPESLPNYFIKNFTYENDLIFDPFMGSGTTAISCLKNNRNYIGCEIDNEYYKSCINRIKLEKAKIDNEFYLPDNEENLFSQNKT